MFSLVNSSCSSSKDSELRDDERVSDQLPIQEANPVVRFEAHNTNFSIRDHVLASRSKNIGASWPFPRQLLQICLKNGIRDLLPPFEPHSSVRSAHCPIKPKSEVDKFQTNSAQLAQTVLLDGSDEARCLSEQHQIDNLVNDVCGIERFSSPTSEPALKTSKPIQKAGVISETSREEEIIASTSMSSDIMTSKTCPVCKSFSSTSNTTLNAHMDQCLSMDSDATLAVEKIQRIKMIKPKKKRSMEEIYATAPFCTLEDLDRRNGTSWATDLNMAALTAESNAEAKKPKLTESDTKDDNNEGAVYVDSNGIKIGILSKFNDASNVSSREVFRPRKNVELLGDGKIISLKKDHSGALSSEKLKIKMRNKKLRSFKLFENEVQAGPAVSQHEESHIEEEGSPVHLSGELDKSLSCGSATLKNWPSSKRSEFPKKSGKKDFQKIYEHLKSASVTPSATRSHFGKLSRLLKSKTVDFPSNTVQNLENEKSSQGLASEGTSTNALVLKLSRVSGSLVSSQRSSSEEICMGRKHKPHASKLHKRLAETSHLQPKTKKMSTLNALNSSTIRMGKHRSLLAWTDTQTRTSKVQVDENNLSRASSENANASSIMQKSLVDEDRDRQDNANDETSLMVRIGPMKQVNEQAPDQLENRSAESQSKATSAEEFGACLTGHELALDIPIKNFSIASDHLLPKQDNNLACGLQPSVSPASSDSTISPASPNDYHSRALEIKPASNPSTTQDNLSFPLSFMASKEGHHEMDLETNEHVEKTCCCSWQSFMAGNIKQKPLSNLYIRPSISCFYAYSNSRTDASIAPSMESPTESILTKAFSDVGSTSPSCGTPTQSSSNSILRLMGKDLMVVNNEDSTQIPKIHSPTIPCLSTPFGFSSYASAPNHDTFSFAIRNQSPSMITSPERNLLPGFHQSLNHKAYTPKEVIVIDDSDEVLVHRHTDASSHTMFQRPFSYFPPHNHLLPMDIGIRPSNPINQGSSFPAPHFPSPFVFQSRSATHLNSPFHYQPSFR